MMLFVVGLSECSHCDSMTPRQLTHLSINRASYVNRDGEYTILSVYCQSHHLWFLPLGIAYLRAQKRQRPYETVIGRTAFLKAAAYVFVVSFLTLLVVPIETRIT